MADTKTKERRKRAAGRGLPDGEQARSEVSSVSKPKKSVKLTPAQKGAITRAREVEFRAKVVKARAREQKAAALRQLREAEASLAAKVAEERAAAEKALRLAKRREIASRGLATAKEAHLKRQAVQQAEIELAIVEQATRAEAAQVVQEVRLGREILEEQISKYYVRAAEEGKVKPLSDRHPTGTTWRHESRARVGAVVDRNVGRFLREGTVESMVRRLVKAAIKAKKLQPDGKLYVSFSIFEYGRNVPKSHGPALYDDAIGSFWQAYDGTAALAPTGDIAGFEVQIREILEERIRSAGSANAVLIDSFEVKSYYERTLAEEKAYTAQRRALRRMREALNQPNTELGGALSRPMGTEIGPEPRKRGK